LSEIWGCFSDSAAANQNAESARGDPGGPTRKGNPGDEAMFREGAPPERMPPAQLAPSPPDAEPPLASDDGLSLYPQAGAVSLPLPAQKRFGFSE